MNQHSNTKESLACNTQRLMDLRALKGWTQAELADKTGLSEQVIVKAESGRNVSSATVAALAKALSDQTTRILPAELSFDPVKLAQQYMEAVYTHGPGCVDAMMHFLHPEFTLRIAGNPAEIPFAGEHRGIEAVRRAFEIFFSILEVPAGHDHRPHYQYLGQGNEVMMSGASYIHPKGHPLAEPIKIWHRFVFADGKLMLLEDLFDTLSGKEAIRKAEEKMRKAIAEG